MVNKRENRRISTYIYIYKDSLKALRNLEDLLKSDKSISSDLIKATKELTNTVNKESMENRIFKENVELVRVLCDDHFKIVMSQDILQELINVAENAKEDFDSRDPIFFKTSKRSWVSLPIMRCIFSKTPEVLRLSYETQLMDYKWIEEFISYVAKY